jgi:hypothetical protein
MQLGIPVPQVYIVPVDRFCREMGPALGVNLAEFEFPAYFNFFVYKKRCVLVVDSVDAEDNIRRVFGETLLGPEIFRREKNPLTHKSEDFHPDFPKDAIPNFQKELKHFRIMPDQSELVIETLLTFRHFENKSEGHKGLGAPPTPAEETEKSSNAPSYSEASFTGKSYWIVFISFVRFRLSHMFNSQVISQLFGRLAPQRRKLKTEVFLV